MSPVTQGMKAIFMAQGVPPEIATEIAGELHFDLKEHLNGDLDALGKLLATASIGDEQPIVDAGLPHQLYDHIPTVDLNPLR